MKICYIISEIDKAVFFEDTAIQLRSQGVELSFVLINSTNGKLHQFLCQHQFEVITLEVGSLLHSRKQIVVCKRWLVQQQITHVHCHLASANWVGLWASWFARIKSRIYTRHSGRPLKLHWKERVIDWFQNRLATTIIAISVNIEELLIQQRVSKKKIQLIHHGFNINRFSEPDFSEVERIEKAYNPENQYPVIGIVARRMKWKGIQFTIEGFEKLLPFYPNALLCLFGDPKAGDYAVELELQLSQLPQKNVCIIPFEYNVFDMYQLMDVYVHVPVDPMCEAFGQTYIEALAARVPAVFTLSGIAREFIKHKQNAYVVPFCDSKAIYHGIEFLLSNKEISGQLIENGYKDVEEMFAFSSYIQRLIKLYE